MSLTQTPEGTPQFVRKLDTKHLCWVCKQVVRDAMQTSCGHRICENCIPTLFLGKNEPVMCPAHEEDCDEQTRQSITPDRSGQREIRNLLVYCDYKEFGCNQELKWKDLEDHKQGCRHKPVVCPHAGCGKMIAESAREKHMTSECAYRPVDCQYCKLPISASAMESHVQNECLLVQLTCPYDCQSPRMEREELNRHKANCPKRPEECKFKKIGCEFVGTGEEVANHEVNALNDHLQLVTVYAAQMEVNSVTIRRELQDVRSERDRLRQQVASISQEMVALRANYEKIQNSNKDLKLKMVSLTERVIHLEKQSETAAKKDVVDRHDRDVRSMQTSLTQVRAQIVQLERQGEGRPSGEAASAPELKRRIDMHDTQFAQLDVQLAELDLRFQILETASYDGTLMWKLRDYTRRKQDAVQGRTLSLYSQPFYTHRYGYKMCARIYLNGDGMGKGSHMSLFFVVMKGEYDNLLPWPFQQKVTMTLLDQETGQCNLSDSFRPDPTSTSFKKPTTDMNIASGCPLFVSHAVLETPKYVKDDTVMIKFHVDIQNLNHP